MECFLFFSGLEPMVSRLSALPNKAKMFLAAVIETATT